MRGIFGVLSVVSSVVAGPFGIPYIAGAPSSYSPADFLSFSNYFNTPSQNQAGVLSSKVEGKQAPPGSKVCLTKGCVKAAADLIESMDETIDPCSDFYEFACGNFLKTTVIPEHQTSYGSFSVVRDKLNLRLRKLFEAEPTASEPEAYQNVRNMYHSCMDTETIEEKSVEQLMAIVTEVGGWPVLMGESWNGEGFKWHELSVKASDKGFNSDRMISIGIGTDSKDSTKRILEIDQPSLGLSREYLIKGVDDKDVKAYLKYMVDTAVFLGANREVAQSEMRDVLDFEIKIAEINLPKEERRNKTALYNPMTVKEASALYPDLPWVEYMNAIMSVDRSIVVDENEVVNVAVPKYLTDFNALIPTIPARTIANLIMFRNIKASMGYLTEEALDIQLAFSKAITGKASKSPRWEKCVKATAGLGGNYFYYYEGSLTNAVGAMYAKKYFKAAAKEITDEMVVQIREEFKLMLDDLDWMDDTTRARAHKKADQITPHIAYSKEILDDELIEEFYNGLILPKDSYLGNILILTQWISAYYAKEFRKPIDKQSWKTHGGAAIVNAFYNPSENSINFPAGILDGVFFQEDRPLYMNYGAIGYVVGHEITHGFDDQGSQKDGEGNLVDWWEPETKERYLEKAQCIIDQYANYTVEVEGETLNLNGINAQGENIADNGGVREALLAYNRLVNRHGVEPILPGINYSPRQLFWLSGARKKCNARRPAALKNQVLTDPHSPSRFRVNGPFANLVEFSEDWGCPVGSPMNPVKKCQVW
jgi:membrane metallo-endopeptidase-like protein 1